MTAPLSRDYLEARSLFDDLTLIERLAYARVLYGMGYSPSDACSADMHDRVRGVLQESSYCVVPTACSCDCHLEAVEYADLHKTPSNEQ